MCHKTFVLRHILFKDIPPRLSQQPDLAVRHLLPGPGDDLQHLSGGISADQDLLPVILSLRPLMPLGEVQRIPPPADEALPLSDGQVHPFRPQDLEHTVMGLPGEHQGRLVEQ